MEEQAINDCSHQKLNIEKIARWKRKFSNLAIAFALLVSFCMIAFSLAIPEILRRNQIEQFRERGIHIATFYQTPRWIEKVAGDRPQFRLQEKVSSIDFPRGTATDQDLLAISNWSTLNYVSVSRAHISEQALSRFLSLSPDLKQLQIVSCEKIKPAFIRDIKKKYPHLVIRYRGVAYLGIAGRLHPRGCEIQFIDPGKPAHKAGLKTGDIITAFNSKKITSFEQLVDLIAECVSGEEVSIDVIRQNQKQSFSCTLTNWSDELR